MPAQPQIAFDGEHYLQLIRSRGELIRRLVPELKAALGLSTALDAGCGVGFFAAILEECGLAVRAFDGREGNIREAHRRYPRIPFEQGDVQSSAILSLGSFDLVLCFGLLYHLENPLLAIRHLHALTAKVLLLESVCIPGDEPFALLRDEPSVEDQSLTDVAFYPSESCLVKMCYRAGFSHVLRVSPPPDHTDFRDTTQLRRRRTVLLAARGFLALPGLENLPEPRETADPWERIPADPGRFINRVRRFLVKPWREKYASIAARIRRLPQDVPRLVRLPCGAWWIARNDNVGQPIRENQFETAQSLFVERLLRPGMTVLDLGAHHGFYTLLASKKVGGQGKVIAFEPSPRERKFLRRHLLLNHCKNVTVEGVALGSRDEEADLYLVVGTQTGCNSLRPPVAYDPTRRVRVRMARLDGRLRHLGIEHVDFIKLDVEGGELDVLRGAGVLLENRPRPTILAEVQDVRTAPWGYDAREILRFLQDKDYDWFDIDASGRLVPLDLSQDGFDGNFVACPEESMRLIEEFKAPPLAALGDYVRQN